MPFLGAHMSVAGGYYKAVERAAEVGCEVVQCFTKNNNQWRARELSDDDAARFQQALRMHKIKHPLSHSSYLINLASPDKMLWAKSIDAMVVELLRAAKLGIPWVVVHPGAFTTSSEQAGLQAIIAAVNEVLLQTRGCGSGCLLENTAGQGTCLGWRFEHLATILDGVADPDRVGVCIDTCHAFAAGYPLGTEKDYLTTMQTLVRLVGAKRIRGFHLNDSKREFNSRVDRHANIGHGCMGLAPFRFLLNDSRFRRAPMYLETPKGKLNDEDWDAINLRTLRELIEPQATKGNR